MRIGGIISLAGMTMLPIDRNDPHPIQTHMAYDRAAGPNFRLVHGQRQSCAGNDEQHFQPESQQFVRLSSGLREFGSFIGSLVGGFLPGFFSALSGHSLESPEPFSSAIVVSLVVWVLALIPIFMIKGGTAPPRKQHNQIRGKFPFLSIAVYVYVCLHPASQLGCLPILLQSLYGSGTFIFRSNNWHDHSFWADHGHCSHPC